MYYFILITFMVLAGLFVFFMDKYFYFKSIKELFKANLSYKISIGSGTIAMFLILFLMLYY